MRGCFCVDGGCGDGGGGRILLADVAFDVDAEIDADEG